jgi:hypothetical protein
VVEGLLIGDVWSIFSPSDVGQMTPSLISKIAAESPESQALRQQLDRKLRTLKRGMEICKRHSTHSAIGRFHLPCPHLSSWHLYVIGNPRIIEEALSQSSGEDGQGFVVVGDLGSLLTT